MSTDIKSTNNRVVFLIGIALAIGAFGLVILLTRSSTTNTSNGGPQTSSGGTRIVAAKADLPIGKELTQNDVALEPYSGTAPIDALTDVKQVNGNFLVIAVTANTPITANMLASQPQPAKPNSSILPITKGDVAMAIPVSGDVVSTGFYIQPEDHIDILMNDNNGTVRYALQDVRILKVGDSGTSSTGTSAPSVYIIELPRNQAEIMSYLLTLKPGILHYVLRPYAEYGKPGSPNYQNINGTPPPAVQDNGVNAANFSHIFQSP